MPSLVSRAPRVRRLFVSSILCFGLLARAHAQYPGHIEGKKEKPAVLRSIAVLEWVGDPGKPSASRIVPITIYDGKVYQDAGVYMASPAPLALEAETEYQLFRSGMPQGNFDVFSAGEVEGFWYGYGAWKPIHEAPPPKLVKSKVAPQIVADADTGRPHFKGVGTAADSSGAPDHAGDGKSSDSKSSEDDKPTLKKRSGDSTTAPGSGTTQAPASGGSSNGPKGGADSSRNSTDDPDRPHLRKRSTQAEPATPQEAVTAVNNGDPDRPRLRRGQPLTLMAADHLSGTPPAVQQMIAVSDASYHEPHSYTFEWANPDDAQKMQKALEQIARDTLNAKASSSATSIPAKSAPKTTSRATSRAATPTRPAARSAAKKQPAETTLPLLVDEDFKAFELAYSGGSTLVFTARTSDDGTPVRYVTLIAQPDFYGVPQVLFKQVTDVNHLNFTPRMRLVDAVDTDADNRAELVFEQRGKSDRQFAIYSVKGNRVEQVFATGSLP